MFTWSYERYLIIALKQWGIKARSLASTSTVYDKGWWREKVREGRGGREREGVRE